jgi:hypothetical protein
MIWPFNRKQERKPPEPRPKPPLGPPSAPEKVIHVRTIPFTADQKERMGYALKFGKPKPPGKCCPACGCPIKEERCTD